MSLTKRSKLTTQMSPTASNPSKAWCIKMIQKKSVMRPDAEMGLPPTPIIRNIEAIEQGIIERKNQFEKRGTRTVLGKPYDLSYLKTSFSVKNNLYGAKLNTPELHIKEPNHDLKMALREAFAKGGAKKGSMAAGTPTRARMTENLQQMPQWERVPQKSFDKVCKSASMQGNLLKAPIYRIR